MEPGGITVRSRCDTSSIGHLELPAQFARAHPAICQVREHLPNVDDEAIFEMSLSFMLAGLHARARRPCTCPKHAGAAGT
jgi:hypothetical protein